MELEVAALRRELFEKEEQTYADRESLAREVEQLLARQAEMSSNLAQVRREKEMLEEDNEVLYAKAEEESERARAEAEAAALARTPTTSNPKAPSPPDRGGGVDGPDTPPTADKATTPPPNKPEGDETRRTTEATAVVLVMPASHLAPTSSRALAYCMMTTTSAATRMRTTRRWRSWTQVGNLPSTLTPASW